MDQFQPAMASEERRQARLADLVRVLMEMRMAMFLKATTMTRIIIPLPIMELNQRMWRTRQNSIHLR